VPVERTDDVLFVVSDDAGTLFVSLDEPAVAGKARRDEHDGVVHLTLLQYRSGEHPVWSRIRSDPLSLVKVRGLVVAAAAVLGVAAIVFSVLLTRWLAVPLSIAAGVYLLISYDRYAAGQRRAWAERHLVLNGNEQVRQFQRAFTAAKTISLSWPQLSGLLQMATPGREVAGTLWTLAGLLRNQAVLSNELRSLEDARAPLKPKASVHGDLEDRITRIREALAGLEPDVERRITSLETLARECDGLARDERAITDAYAAIERADRSLSGLLPDDLELPDLSRELTERVQSIIAAYRELTGLD
jgi:hypothetical protein